MCRKSDKRPDFVKPFSCVNALVKILGSLVGNNVSNIILRTEGHMNEWEKAETR